MRTLLAPMALLALAAACGNGAPDSQLEGGPCTPSGAGVKGDLSLPKTLDAFCQVRITGTNVVPTDPTVVPYDLNTPLFSDYAVKFRTVWLPPGTSAPYASEGTFAFPVGTVITKSFGWPADFRVPNAPVHWLETRVLVHTPGGWTGASYEWNEAQTIATLTAGGDVRSFSFVSTRGTVEKPEYLVPSQAQCPKCHASDGVFTVLGPTASQINRTYPYAQGSQNELLHWASVHILSGAPAPQKAPVLPVWDDPKAGTTEQRARAYLQANCSYCHNPAGEARTTGLVLLDSEKDPAKYGVCKAPIAAGRAGGNDQFDVVPGRPDESILIARVTSTVPSIAMPELGRSLEHVEGVALLSAWVKGLPGSCP